MDNASEEKNISFVPSRKTGIMSAKIGAVMTTTEAYGHVRGSMHPAQAAKIRPAPVIAVSISRNKPTMCLTGFNLFYMR